MWGRLVKRSFPIRKVRVTIRVFQSSGVVVSK